MPGAYVTGMPRSFAAFTSMASNPVASEAMSRSFVAPLMASAVTGFAASV